MARSGQFSGSTFLFGAPLLSVHPIDNKFPDREKDDDGETQPLTDDRAPRPESDRDTTVTPLPKLRGT